jgi:hypothetical protein
LSADRAAQHDVSEEFCHNQDWLRIRAAVESTAATLLPARDPRSTLRHRKINSLRAM